MRGGGRWLWKTDGTAEGTVPRLSTPLPYRVLGMASHRNALWLRWFDEVADAWAIWTLEPDDPAPRFLLEAPVLPTPIAGWLFFPRNDEGFNSELWVAEEDGTNVRQVADLRPGPIGSGPEDLILVGDRIFFTADDGTYGRELWALPLSGAGAPPPPPGPWVRDASLPGFQVKVRIRAGVTEITGRKEPACISETICLSGAVPGRSEVLVRVVGPKPNGRLWPTIARFSTSTIEVWIEQLATGEIRYYLLEGATPGSSELKGLIDREGFEP